MTKGLCQSCWEIDASLNNETKVNKIFEKLTTEIDTLRGKLKKINFPRNLLERSWKIHPGMKLFIFSNSCEDVEDFLEWNSFEIRSKKRVELSTMHEVEQALSQAQEDNRFVFSLSLISKEDSENLQV